ncbi:MAG TPA: heme peroxidase family protein [Vicinamibacterales bacterium]|nr:heme peroxidase family protein [Vicinamibacterales bacterium]
MSMTRRGFLTGLGTSAAGAAGAAVLGPPVAIAQTSETHARTQPQRFSRMFPGLPSFAEATPAMRAALADMGAPGGLMDAQDPLHLGPIELITKPDLSPNNRDNPTHTAGITFLGQFIDHDMTFDTSSPLGVPTAPESSANARTPSLDLDAVYGRGWIEDPHLYDPADRIKMKVESGGTFEDVPRMGDENAMIADPRNDEHVILAGMQAAFLMFHNNVVDMLRDDGDEQRAGAGGDRAEARLFARARQIVTWHYQWIVVNEFLPAIIGAQLTRDILRGGRFYRPRPGEHNIPVEFQGAAYRFGHSMVRPSYRANLGTSQDPSPFFGFIFEPLQEGTIPADPPDLRGGCRAARRFVGWQTFFDFGSSQSVNARPNKRIDTKISTPLFQLPLAAIASHDLPTALPQRNLLRHLTWSLPSGQAIAAQMGIRPLAPSQLSELSAFDVGLENSTPLWYYVLKEAEVMEDGLKLTGVGARLVGEVIIGLLQLDSSSYLSQGWRPTLPRRARETFDMVDLLTFAGVDPATRGQ